MQTILAVDDDDTILMTIERALSDEYNVIAVNSGAMAFKYLYQRVPDLILLDILMPQMDGIEILNKVRGNKDWKYVPVIFMTSKKKTFQNEKLLQSGVADYIEKPIISSSIKRRIGNALLLMKELEKENKVSFKPLNVDCVADSTQKKSIMIPGVIDGLEIVIPAEKIILVDLRNNDYHIHTQHMDVISKYPLPKLEQLLDEHFLRINPNLLINLKYVRFFSDHKVTMENGKVIMLPNKNKKELSTKIIQYWTRKIKQK